MALAYDFEWIAAMAPSLEELSLPRGKWFEVAHYTWKDEAAFGTPR
jgi:hypothetical protein